VAPRRAGAPLGGEHRGGLGRPRLSARGASAQATLALVLRRIDYGEADRVVTLLTEEHGKIASLARGARRSKQRFGAALEPFAVVRAQLSVGQSSLATLREASPVRSFPSLLARLPAIRAAGEAIEKTRDLLPDRHPDARVFATHVGLLEALDAGGEPDDLALAFELRILALLGHPPRLDACARCGKRRGDRTGMFAASQGGLVCRACGGGPLLLSARALDAMQRAIGAGWADVRFEGTLGEVREAVLSFVDWQLRTGRGQDPRP
jgi:DNA repair protein RecO (recombination protein O)